MPIISENIAMNVRVFPQNSGNKSKITSTRKYERKVNDAYLICDYYKLTGHVKDKCFALHGYPDWHRLYGQPKPKIRTSATKKDIAHVTHQNNSTDASSSIDNNSVVDSFLMTKAQCHQLIQMLQSKLKSQNSTALWLQSNSVAGSFHSNSIMFASPITFSNSHNTWILDSGATHHITSQLNLVHNPVYVESNLYLPNSEISKVSHIGNIHSTPDITLQNVLVVPSFQCNLMSIPQLTTNKSCTLYFSATHCFLQDYVLRKVQEIGNLKDGLYKIHSDTSSLKVHIVDCPSTHSDLVKWHCRLGHPSDNVLSHISCISVPKHHVLSNCDVCHLSK